MKVLTFGEIMLRLKAPGHERFFQSPMLEATFGGGEANVAVSLANYGMDAEFLTILPQNDIADACIRELRYFGVGTKKIVRGEGRMGIYYLEGGANQLPSKVVYDRAYSSIALAKPGDIDWDKAFEGVDWFHITGITPAISESAMELSLESVKEAKKRNITVSCDLNYRKNLWKYGKKARCPGALGVFRYTLREAVLGAVKTDPAWRPDRWPRARAADAQALSDSRAEIPEVWRCRGRGLRA